MKKLTSRLLALLPALADVKTANRDRVIGSKWKTHQYHRGNLEKFFHSFILLPIITAKHCKKAFSQAGGNYPYS
jgi:hypothetical protein